jgi:ribosomal-protein-alanine N-acetyltransferase
VIVRPARPDDVSDVARLEAENLGPDAWSAALVSEGVNGDLPTVHYLVAEVAGHAAGYAVASVAGDVTELQRIAVDVSHRRTGIASALLAEAVALAGGAGSDRLLLEVREDNAGALAFYAGRGFVEVDRRRRYFRDGATAVVLRRSLDRGCGSTSRIDP